MEAAYSNFMSFFLTRKEWLKTIAVIIAGAIFGYFAEIYNDLDFTNWQTFVGFDFIQASIDAFKDWRSIVNKIIFAFGVYFVPTWLRNSKGQYFTPEPKP